MEFLKCIWILNGILSGILVCGGLSAGLLHAIYTLFKGDRDD